MITRVVLSLAMLLVLMTIVDAGAVDEECRNNYDCHTLQCPPGEEPVCVPVEGFLEICKCVPIQSCDDDSDCSYCDDGEEGKCVTGGRLGHCICELLPGRCNTDDDCLLPRRASRDQLVCIPSDERHTVGTCEVVPPRAANKKSRNEECRNNYDCHTLQCPPGEEPVCAPEGGFKEICMCVPIRSCDDDNDCRYCDDGEEGKCVTGGRLGHCICELLPGRCNTDDDCFGPRRASRDQLVCIPSDERHTVGTCEVVPPRAANKKSRNEECRNNYDCHTLQCPPGEEPVCAPEGGFKEICMCVPIRSCDDDNDCRYCDDGEEGKCVTGGRLGHCICELLPGRCNTDDDCFGPRRASRDQLVCIRSDETHTVGTCEVVPPRAANKKSRNEECRNNYDCHTLQCPSGEEPVCAPEGGFKEICMCVPIKSCDDDNDCRYCDDGEEGKCVTGGRLGHCICELLPGRCNTDDDCFGPRRASRDQLVCIPSDETHTVGTCEVVPPRAVNKKSRNEKCRNNYDCHTLQCPPGEEPVCAPVGGFKEICKCVPIKSCDDDNDCRYCDDGEEGKCVTGGRLGHCICELLPGRCNTDDDCFGPRRASRDQLVCIPSDERHTVGTCEVVPPRAANKKSRNEECRNNYDCHTLQCPPGEEPVCAPEGGFKEICMCVPIRSCDDDNDCRYCDDGEEGKCVTGGRLGHCICELLPGRCNTDDDCFGPRRASRDQLVCIPSDETHTVGTCEVVPRVDICLTTADCENTPCLPPMEPFCFLEIEPVGFCGCVNEYCSEAEDCKGCFGRPECIKEPGCELGICECGRRNIRKY